MGNNKLEVANLSFEYKRNKPILKNVNFKMENGVVALLGPNGAGKTTLINVLLGLYKPSAGSICFNGRDIKEMKSSYYNLVGYMPQMPGLYNNYTAWEFLKYMSAIKGLNKKNINAKIEELLNRVNLFEKRNERLGTFSGGMKQRIGIAQALLNDPELLIMDEPTAGLDPVERIRLKNIITEIAVDRIVVFATHIVSDIESIAKQVVLLRDGEVLKDATLSALLKELEGYTWRTYVDEYDEVKGASVGCIVSNVRENSDGRYEINLVSRSSVDEKNMEKRTPVLEDAFLYYLNSDRC